MIRACPSCGTQNRIPAKHLADSGRCGACKTTLPPLSEPVAADSGTFDDIVSNSRVPVLVDFWAAWCGPCRMVEPEVKKAATALAGRAVILKVDTERNPELAARYNVRGIPNFAVFSRGSLVRQEAGARDHRALTRLVEGAAR